VRSISFALLLVACGAPPPTHVEPAPAPVVIEDAADEDAAIEITTTAPGPSFLGTPDTPILEVLATSSITAIERGTGGRSVGFRLTFEDGSRGYFKPEQSFSGSHFYAEVAAYHLDRSLGLGRVPPTIGRRLAWAPLREVIGRARASEVVLRGDEVCGSLSWWVPEPLVRLPVGLGWEGWARFAPPLAVSPFQRARVYATEASGGTIVQDASETQRAAEMPDTLDRAAELSDLVLFDYLTENIDRWGGGYTNVRTRGEGGPLVYLDNAAGFIEAPQASPSFMDARLHAIQRFRRSTVDAIRALSIDALRARTEADACAPILNERFYAQLEERRTTLLAHVDRMLEEHGDAALAW
jgi:hypothetical protein